MNGRTVGMAPIPDRDLRSARRWSKRIGLTELKIANDFMKRRRGEWCRVPPLDWIEEKLQYWMPALAGSLSYISGPYELVIDIGLVVLVIAAMYHDLLTYEPKDSE